MLEGRFRVVAGAVVVVSTLVFCWVLTLGRGDFLARSPMGGFFDVQGRSLLDGQLHAEEGAYSFEGFVVDGRTYTYFGVFPSLLRVPVLVATDDLDGRLTAPSMLLAYVVAMVATALLVQRVRALARPEGEWTTSGLAVAGILLAVVGLGSNLLVVAGTAWVYTEAALWGAAGVLASFAALAGFLLRPERAWPVVWAGLWAAVAWLSRGSVGLAPTIALALVGVAHLTAWRPLRALAPSPIARGAGTEAPDAAPHPGPSWARSPRRAGLLVAAAVLPALAFAAVNTAKFGSPTDTPFGDQVLADMSPRRQATLDEYGGNLFSLRVIVPNLLQYLRPDVVEPSDQWPLVDFTRRQPPDIGGVVYDTVEPTIGLLLPAPALVALAGVGTVGIVRGRRRPRLAALRPMLVGGAVAGCVPLTIAFVAQRYLTDALPLLVIAAAAGVALLDCGPRHGDPEPDAVGPDDDAGTHGGRRTWLVVGGLGALAVGGIYVTVATTWVYQRFVQPPDAAAETAGLRARQEVADLLSTARVPVDRADELGDARRSRGDYVVVGDCDGLYRSNGDAWEALEGTPRNGHYLAELTLDGDLPDDVPVPVLAVGDEEDYLVIGVEAVGEGSTARFVVDRPSGSRHRGELFELAGDEPHELEIWANPRLGAITADLDGRRVYGAVPASSVLGELRWGENPFGGAVGDEWPGNVTPAPVDTPTCDLLTADQEAQPLTAPAEIGAGRNRIGRFLHQSRRGGRSAVDDAAGHAVAGVAGVLGPGDRRRRVGRVLLGAAPDRDVAEVVRPGVEDDRPASTTGSAGCPSRSTPVGSPCCSPTGPRPTRPTS